MILRVIFIFLVFSCSAFSQENFIKHTISKGENLTIISKKYGLKPKDIIDANPDATKILKLSSVLLIPAKGSLPAASSDKESAIVSHQVLPKETLWGISKAYKVSVDDLKATNPFLETEGLKIGQIITIPSGESKVIAASNNHNDIEKAEAIREVKAKETKYSIAKEFGITVAELEAQNPEVQGQLPIGYKLKILTSKEKADLYNNNNVAIVAEDKKADDKIATVTAAVTKTESPIVPRDTAAVKSFSTDFLIEELVCTATENIGTRYRIGGTTKDGFDCSGLMYTTFGNFDIKLPRTSLEQSRTGIKISSEEAQKGDLIFFRTNGRKQINHVGMVVEVADDEIKFVHSSTSGGVIISSTKEHYYEKAFSHLNRVIQ
jgi:peptidoglycan endopeptidase LytE